MTIDPGAITSRLFDVRGQCAVVTGAASGLGLAIAEVLADCGARVTLADVHAEHLEEVAAALTARGCDVRAAVTDVADDASVRALFDGAQAAFGGLDIVFANAGIPAVPGYANPGGQELHTVADDVWRRVLAVNLDGVLHTLRAAAGAMKPQGSGRIGRHNERDTVRLESARQAQPTRIRVRHQNRQTMIAAGLEIGDPRDRGG